MGSDRQGRTADYGVYSKLMRESFESVRKLRAERFKFSDICRAYVKTGVLPTDAEPSSFRKAFRNEAKRRARDIELEKRVTDNRATPPGHDAKGVGKTKNTSDIRISSADTSGLSENTSVSITERAMKNTATKVNMGGTTIIKYADGSFDY